jgi:signal peptidase I
LSEEPVTSTISSTAPDDETAPRESNLLREIVETLLLTAIIFLAVNTAVGRFRIEGPSMQPNLHEGEYAIVDKISYQLHPPERGDIIVFERQGQPDLIKRVIGLPGETIEIRDGQVLINGLPLPEPYLTSPMVGSMPPQTIEADHYFVMGDNRNNSSDSRSFGTVTAQVIVGRAWIIYWPPPNWQIVPHYSYAVAASQ